MKRRDSDEYRRKLRRDIKNAAALLEADAKAKAEGKAGILVPGELFRAVPRPTGATAEEHHKHVRELAPESVAVAESLAARGHPIPQAIIEDAKLEASANAGRTYLAKAREREAQAGRAANAREARARGEGRDPPVSDKVLRRAVKQCATDEDGKRRSTRHIDKLLRERGMCVKRPRIEAVRKSLGV